MSDYVNDLSSEMVSWLVSAFGDPGENLGGGREGRIYL